MIGGFIVTGDTAKKVVLRALGPSLADAGVTGVLADPILELYELHRDLGSNKGNVKLCLSSSGIM